MFTCVDIRQDFFEINSFKSALEQIQSHIQHALVWQNIVGKSGMGKTTIARFLALHCSSPYQAVHHLQLVENLESCDWIWQPLSGFLSGQLSGRDTKHKDNVIANLEAFKLNDRGLALLIDGAECLRTELAWQDIVTLKSIFRRLGPKFTLTFFSRPLSEEGTLNPHPLTSTKSINLPFWTYNDTRTFVYKRLQRLGTDQNVFSDELISAITEKAQGVPLRIVTLCENALMNNSDRNPKVQGNIVGDSTWTFANDEKSSKSMAGVRNEPNTLLELLRSRRSG